MSLTIESVKRRVQEIRDNVNDYEKAHGLEDKLYYEVLVDIGNNLPSNNYYHKLIKEAVKAHKIEFSRYTA